MDHVQKILAFGGGGSSCIMTSVDTNKVEILFCDFRKKKLSQVSFLPNFGITGLQVQDELERTSPSRPVREKMVLDLV